MFNFADNLVGTYRGINVFIKSDEEIDAIVIPQSLAKYLKELEEIKLKYMAMKMEV